MCGQTSAGVAMKLIAVSQRVDILSDRNERRDSIDQRWTDFLRRCGLVPIPIPNQKDAAQALLSNVSVVGILLTGGADLADYGGDSPERDETELFLIDHAASKALPLIGVCRGMQCLLHKYGNRLRTIEGHVGVRHEMSFLSPKSSRIVNSFHKWAPGEINCEFSIEARGSDQSVEAVKHVRYPFLGIMWHPEREPVFSKEDIEIFRQYFLGSLK